MSSTIIEINRTSENRILFRITENFVTIYGNDADMGSGIQNFIHSSQMCKKSGYVLAISDENNSSTSSFLVIQIPDLASGSFYHGLTHYNILSIVSQ